MNPSAISGPRYRFLNVVNELRIALGYSMRSEEQEDGEEVAMEMMYGGFDFSIVHSVVNNPDSVLLECIFGPLPEARAEKIMRRLLEMNAALAELDGSSFSLDATRQLLMYTLELKLGQLDGNVLLRKLTETVWHGQRWQQSYFMSAVESTPTALMNPVQLA